MSAEERCFTEAIAALCWARAVIIKNSDPEHKGRLLDFFTERCALFVCDFTVGQAVAKMSAVIRLYPGSDGLYAFKKEIPKEVISITKPLRDPWAGTLINKASLEFIAQEVERKNGLTSLEATVIKYVNRLGIIDAEGRTSHDEMEVVAHLVGAGMESVGSYSRHDKFPLKLLANRIPSSARGITLWKHKEKPWLYVAYVEDYDSPEEQYSGFYLIAEHPKGKYALLLGATTNPLAVQEEVGRLLENPLLPPKEDPKGKKFAEYLKKLWESLRGSRYEGSVG